MSTKKRKLGKRKPRWLPRLPPTINAKQVVIGLLPYILIAWVGDKLGWLYRYCPGNNLLSRLMVLLSNAQMAFGQPFISFHPRDLLVGVAAATIVRLVVAYRAGNSKKFRHGREYGSARWGTPKDIAPFIDPVYENNIILTATERLTMNGRPYLPKYARNKNVIVIGGSGSGKTRFFVKPNLMQMPEKVSFVVTDPKGSLIIECGRMLVRGGYRVKVLNTINFAKSMHYNPFAYISERNRENRREKSASYPYLFSQRNETCMKADIHPCC